MKYDRKIKSIIKNIRFSCDSYIEFVECFNEDACTDRTIEKIIESAKELEKYHEKRFEINNTTHKSSDERCI